MRRYFARPVRGETIGIWGAGPAGTLLKRASEAIGCRPVVIENDERRRELVNGQEEPPEAGIDIAVIAVGDMTAYNEALKCMAPRGRMVIFSGLPGSNAC